MADCPKCGFSLAENQSECPRCGVILAKAKPARAQTTIPEVPPIPQAPPISEAPMPQVAPIPQAPTITRPVPSVPAVTELRGDTTKLRVFAMMIDNFVATVLFVTAMKLLFAWSEDADYTSESAIGYMAAVIPAASGALAYLLYFFVLEGLWGATLGKLLFGLRVARLDGKPAGLEEAWWRTILRIFEANPVLLGGIPGGLAVMWSKRRQRIGDMVAGTVVVRRHALASAQAESTTT